MGKDKNNAKLYKRVSSKIYREHLRRGTKKWRYLNNTEPESDRDFFERAYTAPKVRSQKRSRKEKELSDYQKQKIMKLFDEAFH